MSAPADSFPKHFAFAAREATLCGRTAFACRGGFTAWPTAVTCKRCQYLLKCRAP